MEKALFNQLAEYLETNQLVHPNHHGGRKGHSTTTSLVQMYNTWVEQMEEGKLVGVLILDQSVTFDLCDHLILVEKLKLLGYNRIPNTLVDGH